MVGGETLLTGIRWSLFRKKHKEIYIYTLQNEGIIYKSVLY